MTIAKYTGFAKKLAGSFSIVLKKNFPGILREGGIMEGRELWREMKKSILQKIFCIKLQNINLYEK